MAFSRDIGIDLGTANTLIFMKGKGIIIREPSVVAVDTHTDVVKCVGQEAKDVIGRTPGSITAVRPLKDGVIADFDITTSMLEQFIQKALNKTFMAKPRVIICIPSGVTAVEKRAVKEATERAGAKRVSIIEEPMAAAIGAGLPVAEPTGNMVVDIGGGSTELVAYSNGKIQSAVSIAMGSLNSYNKFVKGILPTKAERKNIREEFLKYLDGIKAFDGKREYKLMCGVGGTVRAALKLDKMFLGRSGADNVLQVSHINAIIKAMEKKDDGEYYMPAVNPGDKLVDAQTEMMKQ